MQNKPKEQHKIYALVCAFIWIKLERQDAPHIGYFNDFVNSDDYIYLGLDILQTLGDKLVFPNESTALNMVLNTINANELREKSVLFLMMSTMMKRTTPVLYFVFASIWLAILSEKSTIDLDPYLKIMEYEKEKMIGAAAKIMYIFIVLSKKSIQKTHLNFLIPMTAENIPSNARSYQIWVQSNWL